MPSKLLHISLAMLLLACTVQGKKRMSMLEEEQDSILAPHEAINFDAREGNHPVKYQHKGNHRAVREKTWKAMDDTYDSIYKSVLGDGGMRDPRVRVALESWNFCNRVGSEGGTNMPSPRFADCAQIVCGSPLASKEQYEGAACEVEQLVNVADDGLKSGQTFPQGDFVDYVQPDDYAVQKELYLASLCETTSEAGPWHFWMVMLKNGNFDIHSGLCSSTASSPSQSRPFMFYPGKITTSSVASGRYLNPQMTQMPAGDKESQNIPQLGPIVSRNISTASSNAAESMPLPSIVQALLKSANPVDNLYRQQQQEQMLLPPFIANKGSFPCFGHGCMNHPRVFHNWSKINDQEGYTNSSEFISSQTLSGSFFGTYDLDDNGLANQTVSLDSSYFSVDWSKDPQSGSWLFHHVLRVNHKYPWLMLYLRADTTSGLSGGYPWETRGMMIKVPESPNFKVKLTLNVLRGGGSASQFYLLDIGGCWKNDGRDCDGNTSSDVTRYSEMIINPSTTNWCHPGALALCPPYHVDAKTKEHIYRNDTARFPYTAYHYYCVPPNAQYAEEPFNVCDPYSNPQPQEIMQLLPHPEWAIHGYPSAKGQGWIGDSKSWTLDVGGLSQRLYFYQDPGTKPAPRRWTSVDVGTEIFISQRMETAEWIVSDFDVLSADC